jgi:hypothetical protein
MVSSKPNHLKQLDQQQLRIYLMSLRYSVTNAMSERSHPLRRLHRSEPANARLQIQLQMYQHTTVQLTIHLQLLSRRTLLLSQKDLLTHTLDLLRSSVTTALGRVAQHNGLRLSSAMGLCLRLPRPRL